MNEVTKLQAGDRVARTNLPYNPGTVVELNRAAMDPPGSYLNGFYKRARVMWDHSGKRTWVLFTSLREYTGPNRIIQPANGRTGTHNSVKRLQ